MQKDNTTLQQKVSLRLDLLRRIPAPIVLETHGGEGRVWFRCYRDVARGVVFEKDPAKADLLARQRPSWSVYEADCEKAIAAGAGSHLQVNVLDLDPYGEPWTALAAFFASKRPFPEVIGLAVNDGIRIPLASNRGWKISTLAPAVAKFGNHQLYARYLEAARFLVEHYAGPRGYEVEWWRGYYCGKAQKMTHYAAVLRRSLTPGQEPAVEVV